MTLTNRIAAVHVVYDLVCEELHWFGQLTSLHPGILSALTGEGGQEGAGDEDMVREWVDCSMTYYCFLVCVLLTSGAIARPPCSYLK